MHRLKTVLHVKCGKRLCCGCKFLDKDFDSVKHIAKHWCKIFECVLEMDHSDPKRCRDCLKAENDA